MFLSERDVKKSSSVTKLKGVFFLAAFSLVCPLWIQKKSLLDISDLMYFDIFMCYRFVYLQ